MSLSVDQSLPLQLDDPVENLDNRGRRKSPVSKLFTANILGKKLSRRQIHVRQRLHAVMLVTFHVKNENAVYHCSKTPY